MSCGKVSRSVIEYLVDKSVEAVDHALGRKHIRGRPAVHDPDRARLLNFISDVIYRAEVPIAVILATLVYIERAKEHLHITVEDFAHERIFLGALIVAAKYINDASPKNAHWALYTGIFTKRDVCLVEREFLCVLDFSLMLHADDLQSHYNDLIKHATRAPTRRRRVPLSPPSPTEEGDVPQLTSTWSPNSSDASSPASSPPTTPEAFSHDDYIEARYVDKRSDDLVDAFRSMSVSHQARRPPGPISVT
ncbi:hypothetical protein BD626DRAFT_535985 [Schizophyllum amplum]|uniref:Cyclin-like domain-containing protein n=1 Tax=Schizophyllum amplum TaxID=97359 RepID=A0A550CIX1_9AGAR|nr:hypothetical protein BD626DRAFT_535985 [Auriculariopsis ampla]